MRLNISGSVIKAALAHGISRMALSDAATSPSGRFLQVSSNVKYEWYFKAGVPTLSTVYENALTASGLVWSMDWVRLDEARVYTVATNAFVASGGDDFSLFSDLHMERLGVSDVEAAVSYLAANGFDIGAFDIGAFDPTDRIRQLPDRLVLQVRLLSRTCATRLRRACDPPLTRLHLVNAPLCCRWASCAVRTSAPTTTCRRARARSATTCSSSRT